MRKIYAKMLTAITAVLFLMPTMLRAQDQMVIGKISIPLSLMARPFLLAGRTSSRFALLTGQKPHKIPF